MDNKFEASNNRIKRIIQAFFYFLCLIAFYINIGQDMGPNYFLPVFIPIIITLVLLQYGTHMPIAAKANIPNLITGLAWASAFPILYSWTYEKAWFMSKIYFDFLVGTAFFVFLTSLEGRLMRSKHIKLAALLMTILNLILLTIPIIEYTYYCLFWHCLSPASLMALYLTNYQESIDFLLSNMGVAGIVGFLAVLFLVLYIFYRLHLVFAHELAKSRPHGLRTVTLTFLIAFSAFWGFFYYLPQTSFAGLLKDVTDYVAQTEEYSQNYESRFSTLDVEQDTTLSAAAPGTVIVVIGESASRDYMKAYTPDFPYDDTPWLSTQAQNPDFIIFRNAYSSWSQTVPALQRALTEQSQYNNKNFINSTSIIDVAKKAGYETYWFSNQGRYGQFDSIITLIAKTADHSEWTDDSYEFTSKYDEVLLEYLKKVNPKKSNFIVLHLMGSHIYYNNRYPHEYAKWNSEDGTSMMLATPSYANSILYTDHVLNMIFDYAKQNLNLTCMLYFSDHGENLQISHNPDVFSFDMVRIPMFVYLSPEYQSVLPSRSYTLYEHRGRYFTNDMLYDTISGLINAPSSRYEARQDLSSAEYGFQRATLTTMLGQQQLTSDPKGGQEEFF